MKTMFQNVFKNQQKAKELFDANKKFFSERDIFDMEDLQSSVLDLNSSLYNFIK